MTEGKDESLQNGDKEIPSAIYEYWNHHTLGLQYVTDKSIKIGGKEFFDHIRPWMNPYKFPWIMERIERESELLRGKHLLEVGCGMGYDSVEYLKRGVRVTASDLTASAVEMTRRHFEHEGVRAEDIRVEDVLNLTFEAESFDAVWANGVVHATGDTPGAIKEIHRVLKPGGRAIVSHFYRKPSWMYLLKKIPGVNIEFDEEDPPVNDFLTEKEIGGMFEEYDIIEAVREHYRLLPICRSGVKAFMYNYLLKPTYNFCPEQWAKPLAYKFSITAVKK